MSPSRDKVELIWLIRTVSSRLSHRYAHVRSHFFCFLATQVQINSKATGSNSVVLIIWPERLNHFGKVHEGMLDEDDVHCNHFILISLI